MGLNSYGFDIYAKNIEWNEFQMPDDLPYVHPVISIDEKIHRGGYLDNLKTLTPNLYIPLFSFGTDKEGDRFGFLISGLDALGHFPYSAEFLYDLDSQEPLFNVTLSSRILAPFEASVSAYKKDDKEDSPFPIIRGYNNPLNAKVGASLSADLTAPILSIKRGIFLMPYVFFDGICAGLFYDASIPKGGKNPQMSTGLEFHLETNLAMYLPIDIGARFVINRKDKKPKIESFIGVAGSF